MVVRIPLKYSDRVFTHALVDDEAEPLRDLGYYSVTIPRKLRNIAQGRADVILAILKEDSLMTASCKPFLSVAGTQVLLVHMVVRGQLGKLIREFVSEDADLAMTRSEINFHRGTIGRIVFDNGDSTDCQRHNIKEM